MRGDAGHDTIHSGRRGVRLIRLNFSRNDEWDRDIPFQRHIRLRFLGADRVPIQQFCYCYSEWEAATFADQNDRLANPGSIILYAQLFNDCGACGDDFMAHSWQVTQITPEPGTIVLALGGGMFLLRKRRRS